MRVLSASVVGRLDELLAAVDVVGRAGERGVRHEVDGQRDVGWPDDPRPIGRVARS
jgi:hypothetical protein